MSSVTPPPEATLEPFALSTDPVDLSALAGLWYNHQELGRSLSGGRSFSLGD
jgi:hypothetical protein